MISPKLLFNKMRFTLAAPLLMLGLLANAETGPNLRRACLTNNGKDAILYWIPSANSCGSFRSYHIYARPNNSTAFSLMDSVNVQAQSTFTHINIGVTSWQYFIITHKDCNGDSIVSSDTIPIDLTPPSVSSLDSVSIDINTGSVILGWATNNTPDVAGYFIFRVTGSQNLLWGSTRNPYLKITGTVPQDSVYSYNIASYDSCGLAAAGALAHSTIKLSYLLNECTGEASLTWTGYAGWTTVKGYDVVVDKNGSGYQILTSVDGSTLTYTLAGIKPGDVIKCFVRGWSADNSTISSSSNKHDIMIPLVKLPKVNYLSGVSVTDNSFVTIRWVSDKNGEISTFRLLRGTDSLQMDEVASIPFDATKTEYSYDDKDPKLRLNDRIYYYRILVYDNCENFSGSLSNVSNTIKDSVIQLTTDANQLVWNPYSFWYKGVGFYYIYRGVFLNGKYNWEIAGSAKSTESSWIDVNPPSEAGNTGVCYYVEAHENPGDPFTSGIEVSTSNYSCEIKDFTFFFPNAFNPFGINRKWVPKASYVNYELSTITIYDRWGQRVKTITDIHDGWDGKDGKGDWMEPGLYIFTASITGVNRRKQTFEGKFVFLR